MNNLTKKYSKIPKLNNNLNIVKITNPNGFLLEKKLTNDNLIIKYNNINKPSLIVSNI